MHSIRAMFAALLVALAGVAGAAAQTAMHLVVLENTDQLSLTSAKPARSAYRSAEGPPLFSQPASPQNSVSSQMPRPGGPSPNISPARQGWVVEPQMMASAGGATLASHPFPAAAPGIARVLSSPSAPAQNPHPPQTKPLPPRKSPKILGIVVSPKPIQFK